MARRELTSEEVLTLLEETPKRIAGHSDGLEPAQLRTVPDHDEWSVNDVLAHLRSCADVWGGCITTLLAEDHPTIRAVNPRSWIKGTDYPEMEFRPSFRAFTAQREELLELLNSLTLDDWERGATVTGAGSPLERTVRFYAQWLARHERSHYKQIERIFAAVRA